jgi:predicted methyltransferase
MLKSKGCLTSRSFAVFFAALSMTWAVSSQEKPMTDDLLAIYKRAVASPIRTDEDRAADVKRKPLEFLQFTDVRPGMQVLDVAAGGGYTTQLLALVVGNKGTVWAQSAGLNESFVKRLDKNPQPNINADVLPYDDPVPLGAKNLDLVTIIMNYHDIAYMPVDRAQMDKRLFNALKPGGHLVVLDHSAKEGSGVSDAKTLHRIDEKVVLNEFEQAGFKLEKEGDFMRNPEDPRDQAFFNMKTQTDKFALRFVKP